MSFIVGGFYPPVSGGGVVGDVEIRRWEDDYIDVCGSVVVWQCDVDYIDV